MSNEVELQEEERQLLALLRRRGGGDRGAGTGPGWPRDAAGWDRLLEAATPVLHPWLDHLLREAPPAARPPATVRSRLEAARRASLALHLQRREELRRILPGLERRGVPALVLKGMALACLVHPDPSLRPMVDIDLLVPEAAWEEARSVLIDLGLRVPLRHASRPETGPNALPERGRPFQRPGTRVMVDLHDRLEFGESPAALPGTEDLWASSIEADLDGVPARVLGWEDLLVHLCLHLSGRHLFDKGLMPLLDLALFLEVRGDRLPGGAGGGRAAPAGSGPWLSLPLRLARDLLDAPVPDGCLASFPSGPRGREMLALAGEQVLRTGRDRISPGLVSLAAAPPGRRIAHAARRLNPWRRGEDRSGLTAARRLAADIVTRARVLVGAWRRGDLTRAGLDRSIRLQEGRERLAELMRSGGPADPGARPSSRRPAAGED